MIVALDAWPFLASMVVVPVRAPSVAEIVYVPGSTKNGSASGDFPIGVVPIVMSAPGASTLRVTNATFFLQSSMAVTAVAFCSGVASLWSRKNLMR